MDQLAKDPNAYATAWGKTHFNDGGRFLSGKTKLICASRLRGPGLTYCTSAPNIYNLHARGEAITPDRDSPIDRNVAVRWRPGKLWSLWDMLVRFNGGKLLSAINGLSLLGVGEQRDRVAFPEFKQQEMKQQIEFICSELPKMGLEYSLVAAEQLRKLIFDGTVSVAAAADNNIPKEGKWVAFQPSEFREYRHAVSDLLDRARGELGSKLCLVAPSTTAAYFDSAEPLFGIAVFSAFPSANDDIAEAGMCLALERSTASVMHLRRVLEVGLQTLAGAVGVAKRTDGGARSADEQFYAETAINIDNMRRAWRNPTMQPEKTYSQDRAEEILRSVKSFMIHLSTKLHE